MSAGALPRELTRGYAKSFLDMLGSLPAKVLTIKDLENLDAADFERADSTARDNAPLESDHDPAQ